MLALEAARKIAVAWLAEPHAAVFPKTVLDRSRLQSGRRDLFVGDPPGGMYGLVRGELA